MIELAERAEVSDTLELAAQAYASALQLDHLYVPAQQALQKVEAKLRDRAFQDLMGQALAAIETGTFDSAEKSLIQAAKINPGHSAIKDARVRLVSARRQQTLLGLRKQSEQLVVAEDWTAAIQLYQRALAIDSQAAFALNGLGAAQNRQRLHRQLDHYLADTTRLFSEEPRENASKLLEGNRQVAASEPTLSAKLSKLQQAVTLAATPVDLLIMSDNLTEVTVYKIGRLGSFEQKRLNLLPGKYTITGSRQGYRDVLKTVDLKPGVNGQSLNIRTEEQI